MRILLKFHWQAIFFLNMLLLAACTSTPSTRIIDQTPTRRVAPEAINTSTLAMQSAQSSPDSFGLSDLHNRWRQPLGITPLRWSSNLATSAQQWANALQQQGCQLQHDPRTAYGENLAAGSHLTAASAVKLWAKEAANYDAHTGHCMNGEVCRHYTQMVWAGSQEIGCGVAYCQQFALWVCRYNPPGNVAGYRPD